MRGRTLQEIEAELNAKREEMVAVGMEKGLTHPDTVKISQEVDRLHNEHMQVERENKNNSLREAAQRYVG